ncbi:uncharacterized protein BDW43DRAFT_261624 [Aspergillus alliaceus]|uniref:uncharacterized protein n=1 Tax=Petromyces alliaceus TaxID=209559 RepID=UPI0012A529CF|nr:uncharacterized protein BDW43DRAFT_261624 [Aspergillus alliaceus]KAB8238435.1 hypothetical protein BDW43DRAFT_261624 [Aspergillus alliaceus]
MQLHNGRRDRKAFYCTYAFFVQGCCSMVLNKVTKKRSGHNKPSTSVLKREGAVSPISTMISNITITNRPKQNLQ